MKGINSGLMLKAGFVIADLANSGLFLAAESFTTDDLVAELLRLQMSRERIPAVSKKPLRPTLEKKVLHECVVRVLYLIRAFLLWGEPEYPVG